MMELLKTGKTGYEQTNKIATANWIRLISPTTEELEQIKKLTDAPEDFLLAVQDADEIPFIERDGTNLFVLIRIPIKSDHVPYKTAPLGIILTKNKFVTISYHENEVIPRFKTYKPTATGIQTLLKILYATARTYIAYLKEINKQIHSAEEDLEKATKNEDLLELFELEKSLIYFSTSISNNRVIVERLNKLITKKDKELWDDVLQEYRQAAYTTKIYSIVITSTIDTFGSIISNNLNKVVKRLTVITVILMIPTLVASMYGMNVELPLQHSPHAFYITITVSVLLSIIGVIFLRKKGLV